MRKTFAKFLLPALTLCCVTTASAQQRANTERGLFTNYGADIKMGLLYGLGLDVSTSLHPSLSLRAGYSFLNINAVNSSFVETEGTEQIDKAKANFSNFNLLLDYFPSKNGVFFVTGGLFFGHNSVEVAGRGYDDFSFNGFVIRPDQPAGTFSATAKFGGTVKPYLGIGVGRTIPNSRVGFRFEVGAIYQGKFSVESPQLDPNGDPDTVVEAIEFPVLNSSVWPMANLTVTVRIK